MGLERALCRATSQAAQGGGDGDAGLRPLAPPSYGNSSQFHCRCPQKASLREACVQGAAGPSDLTQTRRTDSREHVPL